MKKLFFIILISSLSLNLLSQIPEQIHTIPVVVHIIHYQDDSLIGNGTNIADSIVFSQIAVLTEDFRRFNADANNTPLQFRSVSADVKFGFCLVDKDPMFKHGV